MKNIFKITGIIFSIFLFSSTATKAETGDLSQKLAGRILLQVESRGQAWYLNPDDLMRYFLGRPNDAFAVMRDLGAGISNSDLAKIPVAIALLSGADHDTDGLPDDLENALGTNKDKADTDGDDFSDKTEIANNHDPLSIQNFLINKDFAERQAGRIFLQVQSRGEAWYVNPGDNKRYYLGRPADAFNVMRALGLGISNNNLAAIVARTYEYYQRPMEIKIHNLVNSERTTQGSGLLNWNDELAAVAREHSENLTRENKNIVDINLSCDFPVIHHEGLDFGIYNSNRLAARGIYYYGKAGENIALVPAASITASFKPGDPARDSLRVCNSLRTKEDSALKSALAEADSDSEKISIIQNELAQRAEALNQELNLHITSIIWSNEDKAAAEIVSGWMDSEGHRKNILDSGYDETGIGVAYIDNYIIATQIFIKRASCGFRHGTCCEKEGYYPYCFDPLKCESEKCEL